jgi:hypothetical protein
MRKLALITLVAAGLIAGLGSAPAQATFSGKNGKVAFSFLPGPTNFGSDNFEIATIVPGDPTSTNGHPTGDQRRTIRRARR